MDIRPARTAPRFFVPDGLAPGARIDLPERAARHITVLRLSAGDAIKLFSGHGNEFDATLLEVSKRRVAAQITTSSAPFRESPLHITLAQCLSSNDRMDLTLQKATELGASEFQPLESERSIVRLSPERMEKRIQHWKNVVISACEQCGRNVVPAIRPVTDLHTWLAQVSLNQGHDGTLRLLLSPTAEIGLTGIDRLNRVVLLVGAEGGLADHEDLAARKAGFQPVRLGPRVLRTETAPLAAISAIQVLWGDLG
jgi:16S rRNA (uracil1498-N3)-methyltransferase